MAQHPANHFSTSDAAQDLGIAPSTLRNWINSRQRPEPGWLRTGRKQERSYSREWIEATRKRMQS